MKTLYNDMLEGLKMNKKLGVSHMYGITRKLLILRKSVI